jgi:hypothetical protein
MAFIIHYIKLKVIFIKCTIKQRHQVFLTVLFNHSLTRSIKFSPASVDATEGTLARRISSLYKTTSTSTLGYPREFKISFASSSSIYILFQSIFFIMHIKPQIKTAHHFVTHCHYKNCIL